MGRCKSLGSWESFLWYAPQLSRASILCLLILSLLRVHSWAAVMWRLDGCNVLCLLIWQVTFFSLKPWTRHCCPNSVSVFASQRVQKAHCMPKTPSPESSPASTHLPMRDCLVAPSLQELLLDEEDPQGDKSPRGRLKDSRNSLESWEKKNLLRI